MPDRPARSAALDGARSAAPLLLGVVPFGLIVGITAVSTEIGGRLGFLSSIVVFAGAAQLATFQLIDQGAAAAVVVATALVINSRHVMYSAGLAPVFQQFPRAWRFALPYALTDQLFVLASVRYETMTAPVLRRWYAVGIAATFWIAWQTSTAIGMIVGSGIPESWQLEFAVPLVFLALIPSAARSRPAVAAAVVAGAVAVVAAPLQWNLGLVVAALSGIVTGVALERWRS